MNPPIIIESFDIEGFRANLKPQSFPMSRGKTPLSVAIFAPNAKGKSSFVDAFEYFFSTDATLQRLGQRAAQTQAGRTALDHIRAADKNIEPKVAFNFRQGTDRFGDYRSVRSGNEVPDAASRVLSAIKVPFIIHGYELRDFVQDTAEDRYREIAGWFSLDALVSIQRNLRSLQRVVKEKTESQSDLDERLRDLSGVTDEEVNTWDEETVCDWFNSQMLSNLDNSLFIQKIANDDDVYSILKTRKIDEENRVGVGPLKRLVTRIETLVNVPSDQSEKRSGLVFDFEKAVDRYRQAAKQEARERQSASQSLFYDIWNNAIDLFDDEQNDFEACPICDTQFTSTDHGSREGVRVSITSNLDRLSAYRTANEALRSATSSATQIHQNLKNAIENLHSGLIDWEGESDEHPISTYLTTLNTWDVGSPLPNSCQLLRLIDAKRESLVVEIERVQGQQGEHTYARAVGIADELIQIGNDLERIRRTNSERQRLLTELSRQARNIEIAIKNHVENLLTQLRPDVDDLYKKIQGASVDTQYPIRLELAPGSSLNQQQVRLVIDYSENRKGVVPSGYLSDSQIHALALALRLAAIRAFNTSAPIIVLDDVVTSFDADHRKRIASTLSTEFDGFQFVLVTHDEQFFALLQDHLPPSSWAFRRILRIDPEYGPVFSDYQTPDEVIDRQLDLGKTAGEEIRKVEEEWLLKICRGFLVDVAIRPVERPYQYERSELAIALQRFLKDRKLVPPEVPGVASPFTDSLQKGIVENFASHFSDNPYRSGSGGDEKTRWEEFKYFRAMFVCSKCGKNRFKRPNGMTKPVCYKCEISFGFLVEGSAS